MSEKKTFFEERGVEYTEGPDGLLYPNLTLPPQEEVHLGLYAMEHRSWLKAKHPGLYTHMLTSVTLNSHLAAVEERARDMEDQLVNEMKKREGVTEQLKHNDQMEWVGRMNNIIARAREIVRQEVICSL